MIRIDPKRQPVLLAGGLETSPECLDSAEVTADARVVTLQADPSRCPIDPDSAAYGREVRVLLYGKRRGVDRILFTIEGDVVPVLTVRHSARRSFDEELEDD